MSKTMRSFGGLVPLAWLLCCATGWAQAQPRLSLRFGVYTTDKPSEMYRTFHPFGDYLSEALTETLGRAVEVRLRIFASYDQAQDALVEREVDFVRFGPASYVLVKKRDPDVWLLAMEEVDGKKRFEGMIVVRQDSPIRSLADLRGRTFAFGDSTSTIGRYLAQDELVSAGITAKDLAGMAYLGRHDKVFRAVELRDYDAGSVKSSTFDKLNKEGQPLRVLHRFDNVTKPWIARSGLDVEVKTALRRALISLRDSEVLEVLRISGFALATDADYALVRRGMQGARKFEGLPQEDPVKLEAPNPARPGK